MGSPIVRPFRLKRLAWAACLLFGLCTPGVAQVEKSPLLEHIDQKMIDIGSQIANARKRLSMSSGIVEKNENGASGMGLTCCRNNLVTIDKKLRDIRSTIERMAAYYGEQQNGEAMGILGELDARLRSISTGTNVFARAPDDKHAASALVGFIRPWNEFRNGVQALRRCCPIPLPVDPDADVSLDDGENDDETGKSKKKDEKAKKKTKEPAEDDSPRE